MMGTAEFIGNIRQGLQLLVTACAAMINMVVSLWERLAAAELGIHGHEPVSFIALSCGGWGSAVLIDSPINHSGHGFVINTIH